MTLPIIFRQIDGQTTSTDVNNSKDSLDVYHRYDGIHPRNLTKRQEREVSAPHSEQVPVMSSVNLFSG